MNVTTLEQIVQCFSSIADDASERPIDRQNALRGVVITEKLLLQAKRMQRAEQRTAIAAEKLAEKTPGSTTQPLPFSPEARVG